MHASLSPYRDPLDNQLESATLVLTIVISVIVAVYSTAGDQYPTGAPLACCRCAQHFSARQTGAQAGIAAVFVLPAALFLLFIVWETIRAKRDTIRGAFNKIKLRGARYAVFGALEIALMRVCCPQSAAPK